jgi:membrane protease YdiL (CAAX protease family)
MNDTAGWTVFGILLALLAPLAISRLGERRGPAALSLAELLIAQAMLAMTVAAVLMVVLVAERKPLASIGMGNASAWSLAWGGALALFLIYVFAPVAGAALRVLKTPGFEETLYRGYAFERIAELSGSTALAFTLPLLMFAVAHVALWGWGAALTTAVSGAIFTAFFMWRHDLAANIVAHVITDFVGIVLPPLLVRWRSKARPR